MKKIIEIIFVLFLVVSCKTKDNDHFTKSELNPWKDLKQIKADINEPFFKDKIYNVLDYGAINDGKTICTDAFKKSIQKCSSDGGGKVVVPAGNYLTGPIHLEDNVNFHLEEGAEILFSKNSQDYYPLVHTSFEGMELMNYSPLIYAKDKINIAVTGKGILNGQASKSNWWTWKGDTSEGNKYGYVKGEPCQLNENCLPRLMKLAKENAPISDRVFGDGFYLRPNFIEFFNCSRVLIKDVKILNAPFWIIHPFKTNNIIIDGVSINSHGPNNDGCDPEYSKNVWIKNCEFNTGDDCIAIKAGRDSEGRRVGIVTENIVIEDCKMIDGHGGIVIGSEMSAGVRNVYAQNCIMNSPELDRAVRLKTNTLRGGFVDGLFVRNIKVGQVKECVLRIEMNYSVYKGQDKGDFIPKIKNIYLDNFDVNDSGKYVVWAEGLDNSIIENVNINNFNVRIVKDNFKLKNIDIKFYNTNIKNNQLIINK